MSGFFRQSDVVTHTCVVRNKTRGGSAFAVLENDEQVFISPGIVDSVNADVGDTLTVYCIPNDKLDIADKSVCWRAIRAIMLERLIPQEDAPVEAPVDAPAVAAPATATVADIASQMHALMKEDRAWTSMQLAKEIGCDRQRISALMHDEHKKGAVAAARIYACGDQEKYSRSYYARSVDILYDLIDEIVLS